MSHPKDKHEQEQHHCNCYDPEHHFPGAVLLTDDPASVERLARALTAMDDADPLWLMTKAEDLTIDDSAAFEIARVIIERLREGVEG